MSTRPPTLREKRRYILARIEPSVITVDQKELYYAIAEAATSLWGDAAAAVITPAVVALESGYAVIRCRRGTERELAIALSTVTFCRDVHICLRIIAASGTIESLRERFAGKKPRQPVRPGKDTGTSDGDEADPGECSFAEKPFLIVQCDGLKVDVIEKGFKNAHRLFLTREDLEDLNATTISDRI